jgi:hypothetical protein
MTNFEKYKTPEEAYQAFKNICATTRCSECSYFCGYIETIKSCQMVWLYTDAEKDPAQWRNNIMDKFTNRE